MTNRNLELYQDKEYMKTILETIAADINELEMWSIWNNNKLIHNIPELKKHFNKIKELVLV